VALCYRAINVGASIGLWERINISVFLLWVVTLAAALWRTGTAKGETAANLGAASWIASSR
jgi:hypothetical protein